jgi:sterol desaturase/sphingolipid hydroxylase (fatty acid hydroxylase superfamily)
MSTSTGRIRSKDFTLADAWREFWKHPSPWMIGPILVIALAARIALGDWKITDLLVLAVMVAIFPFFEWMIHVSILHWRPRRIGRLTIDPLLARKHRAHHADPRTAALIFIPWEALPWVLGGAVAIALLAFPRLGLGLTYLTFTMALGLGYEWTHHLIHTDYKPRTPVYRAIWRNHRLHHFKNEHYWFSITSSGTADRLLRTQPDPATVPTSPTAKNLHANTGVDAPQNRQRPEPPRQNRRSRRRNRTGQRRPRNHRNRLTFRVPAALRAGLPSRKAKSRYAGGLQR